MHDLKIKICGMRDPENIKKLSAFKPDHFGFIFHAPSSRFAGELEAAEILEAIGAGISRTGVFVDAPLQYVTDIANRWQLNAVQLHGLETPEYLTTIRMQLPKEVEIVKAFSIHTDFDFEDTRQYSAADFFLFDAAGGLRGGNGCLFDHSLLSKYSSGKQFWLSGGIGLKEAQKVKEQASQWPLLYGLDINSRIEISPGLKNVETAHDIIEAIRRIGTQIDLTY